MRELVGAQTEGRSQRSSLSFPIICIPRYTGEYSVLGLCIVPPCGEVHGYHSSSQGVVPHYTSHIVRVGCMCSSMLYHISSKIRHLFIKFNFGLPKKFDD
jgi:hypothetical protein